MPFGTGRLTPTRGLEQRRCANRNAPRRPSAEVSADGLKIHRRRCFADGEQPQFQPA